MSSDDLKRMAATALARHPAAKPVPPPMQHGQSSGHSGWLFGLCGVLLGLLIGFFAGREYFKWEVSEGLKKVGQTMSEAFRQPPPSVSKGPDANEARRTSLIACEYVSQKKSDFGTELEFKFTNASRKSIDSFLGGIIITDQFGQRVEGLSVEQDAPPVDKGESFTKSGVWPMVDKRVADLLARGQATVKFRLTHVLYSDGSKEIFQ